MCSTTAARGRAGRPYSELSGLRPSPTGRFAAEQTGLVVVNRDGGPARPTLFHGSVIAWSPDEEWIAEATSV